MRYRMLPYNYNLMALNHIKGAPLMRPLFFEEPNNSQLFDYSSAYLWGQDILVSPVLEPGKKGQAVYFPKDNVWFDFYTDEQIEGGQSKIVELKENSIPTYVKAGAFIPLAKPMQSTKEYDANVIQLQYYYHDSIEDSKREFYFDDGQTVNAFEKQQYQTLEFKAEKEGSSIAISFEADTGSNYKAETKTFELVIHNINEMPKNIKINKEKTNGTFNPKNKTLTLNIIWDTSEEKVIKIKLKK